MTENKSYNDIRNTSEDWELDDRNNLPYSGKSVQDFIKKGINKAELSYEERIEDTYFDPYSYTIYFFKSTAEKEQWLQDPNSVEPKKLELNLAGVQKQLKIINEMESLNVYFTTASDTAELKFSFASHEKEVTSSEWRPITEDAYISVAVDKGGSGEFIEIISRQLLLSGNSASVDVRKYLTTGANRVRVTVTGAFSKAEDTIQYQVNLTSMYLSPSNFTWNIPFIEGREYHLGGMNIGGNIDKKLFVKLTNENGYYKLYEKYLGSSTYITNAYFFNDLEFPSAGTGVYNVELWLDADGLESDHLSYNIICVSAADETTAKLVCISNIAEKAINYADNILFYYTVYNGGAAKATPHIKITAVVNTNPIVIKDEDLVSVDTGTKLPYNFHLEVETDENDLQLTSVLTFGNEQVKNFVIDNSASYPSTNGAVFYMNAANRNNTQSNKKNIVNEITKGTVACDWTNMSFDGLDGWTVDSEGRKCLTIQAGSSASIHYQPLSSVGTGKTIEFNYKVSNVADYSEPIISICDDPTNDKFRGIRILPKKVVLHSRDKNTADYVQSYDLMDEQYVNLLITIVRNYKTNYGNIAIIYVNGVKKCEFEFDNADSWDVASNILLGSSSADLSVYTIRVYNSGFGLQDTQKNYISSLNTSKDKADAYAKMYNILDDSSNIDYDKVYGIYNTMVIELLGSAELPHYGLSEKYTAQSNLELNILNEDEDKPTISGTYLNTPVGGQGTTSMNYFRWNLRWKKTPIRITAKKNYASSMHSHKMGACGAFNDLHNLVVGENEAGGRVAVYQYPAFGFLKTLVEGTKDQYNYQFIGLFTVGPDKGDKGTFGYKHPDYKNTVISLEGTDHSIKGVGFDYPWSELKYVESEESICVDKGNNNYDAAWEVSVCGNKETEIEKQAYLNLEFGPAYKAVYDNSCMIMGTNESIDTINANVTAWGERKDSTGREYQFYEFWIDGEYDLYYLSKKTNTYVKNGVNLLTQLGINESELDGLSIEEKNNLFISKRIERFKEVAANYFHIDDILFTFAFLFIFGCSDNFKKNFYPYKFEPLEKGGRYRMRQDDMDTIADIDNQNLSTKTFSIELGDFTNEAKTAYVFKGEDSVLLQNFLRAFPTEFKQMGKRILAAMYELSETGTNTIDRLTGFFDKYFWNKAQLYFPKSAYNTDAEYSYEEAWPLYNSGKYDVDIHPLSQSRGDHYEAERDWFINRLIYVSSKFGYGPFAQYNDSDLGVISFRTQLAQDFTLTPAIDLYPTIHSGQSAVLTSSNRVKAGESVTLMGAGGSNTNVYIKGADLLSDIGDLSTLAVDAANASIAIASKRLQKLKFGDENAENVTSNLASINIGECPSLMLVDARNLASLSGTIDLTQCPRLREAYFGGTDVRAISLANGSKITKLQLPNTITQISMQNLKFLEDAGFDKGDLSNVEFYRVENCPNLDAFGMLKELYYKHQSIKIEQFSEDITTSPCTLGADNRWYLGTHNECHICIPLKEGEKITIEVLEGGTIPSYAFFTSYNPPYSSGDLMPFTSTENERHIINGTSVTVTAPLGTNYIAFTIIDGSGASYKYKITKYATLSTSPLKNIRVIGFVYDGDSTDVDIIMNLAKDIAADGSIVDYTGIDSEGIPQQTLVPIIEGTLNVAGSVYEDSASFVREQYPNLVLNVTGGYYIRFADKAVQDICAANWGDGLGTTEAQAAAVTSLGTKFNKNANITEFMELSKFGVTSIAADGFLGCTNLTKVDLSKISALNSQAFRDCVNFAGDGNGDLRLPALTSLSNCAFGGYNQTECTGLKRVLDLGNITTLPNRANSYSGVFRNQINLTEVHLPETLETIGSGCFEGCSSLTNINLPLSLININEEAFSNCVSLPIIINTPNLEYLGTNAFCIYGNKIGSLAGIENLGKITTIKSSSDRNSGCFRNQTSLTYAKLPNTLTSIGRHTFYNCSALSSITLPPSITTIDYSAFDGCTSLEIEDLSLPNLTEIQTSVFNGVKITKISNLGKLTSLRDISWNENIFGDKTTLTSVNLPSTLTSVGNYVFNGYTNAEINCNNASITSLGSNAFCRAKKISNLNTPKITKIANYAFFNIGSFDDNFSLNAPNLTSIGTAAFSHSGIKKVENLGTITSLPNGQWDGTLQDNVGVFAKCKNLESCVLPDTLETIGSYAFIECSALPSINLSSSLKTIGDAAFSDCTAFTSIDFPSSITTIGSNAFKGCTSLEIDDLALPNLTSIGNGAFMNVKIRRISNLGKLAYLIDASESGYTLGDRNILEEIILPETMTEIGWNALYKYTALTNVTLPSSLTTIKANAFNGCTALTNITLPSSLVTIEKNAFYNCTLLEIEDLSLPNLETLGSGAFNRVKISKISNLGKITAVNPENWSAENLGDKSVLREITLPNTLKTIGSNTFNGYTALKTITIESGASGIKVGASAFSGLPSSTTFNVDPDAFVSLGSNAFSNTSIWNEVTFTNVTRLDHQVFRGSTISKIKLPSVETMASTTNYDGIFSACPNLILVDIGANCTSIGADSFGRFVGTRGNNITVVVRATTPPSLAGALINTQWVYATVGELYVPDASVDAYKEATNWSRYADIIKPLSEYVE